MKKYIPTILALIFIPTLVFGLSSTVYRYLGNYGVGTTTPQGIFHISDDAPNVYITDTGDYKHFLLSSDSGDFNISSTSDDFISETSFFEIGAEGILTLGSGITDMIVVDDTNITLGSGSESMRIDTTGNVGIGTTSPNYKLSVVGDIFASTTSNQLTLAYDLADDDYATFSIDVNGDLTIDPITSGATTTIASNLKVDGNATTTGSLTIASITGSTQCMQVDTNGLVSGTGAVCGGGGSGGVLGWSYDGGDSELLTRSTTTDPTLIGGSATTSDAAIFEVIGYSVFDWAEFSGVVTTTDGFYSSASSSVQGNFRVDGNATTTGHLASLGGNSDEWNLAYGWGDWSGEGFITDLSGFTTADLSENTNLYYTDNRVRDYINTSSTIQTHFDYADTAYGWGDHSTLYLLDGESDTMTGTLTADGFTLGSTEILTIGTNLFTHDGTDFTLDDTLEVTGYATSTSGLNTQGTLHIGGNGVIEGTLDVTGALTATLTGNASTATASADNPTDCAAGSYPLGVDTNWDAEDCTDASTEIDSIVATHTSDDDAHQALVTIAGEDYASLATQQITFANIDAANTDLTDAYAWTGANTMSTLTVGYSTSTSKLVVGATEPTTDAILWVGGDGYLTGDLDIVGDLSFANASSTGSLNIGGTASTSDGNLIVGGYNTTGLKYPKLYVATSTLDYQSASTATSTVTFQSDAVATTWLSFYCKTNDNAATVRIGDGTNWANSAYFDCTNAGNTYTISSLGGFTANEDIKIEVGNRLMTQDLRITATYKTD